MDKDEGLKHLDIDTAKVLKVTIPLLMEYIDVLEKRNGEITCPACRTSLWTISHSEMDNHKPAVVTYPLPFSHGRGMWAFPMICDSCGYIISFEATKVADNLEKKGKI